MNIDIIGKFDNWNLVYLHIKIIWIIYQEGWNILNLENHHVLSSSAKSWWVFTIILISSYSAYIYLQNRIRVYDLTEHISCYFKICYVKIHISFSLSSGGYNFKINCLKDKMRHGMWVHILLNNLALSPLQHKYYFRLRRSKVYEKTVKFYPEIFEFEVSMQSND